MNRFLDFCESSDSLLGKKALEHRSVSWQGWSTMFEKRGGQSSKGKGGRYTRCRYMSGDVRALITTR